MRLISWLNCNDTLHHAILSVVVVISITQPASTLYVVPGSNCTPACSSALTAYKTNGTDIACHDRDYNGTVVGEAFQECITCEMSSQTVDSYTAQTDLGWALCKSRVEILSSISATDELWRFADNMRYALDWCLFEFPKRINQSAANQCTLSCAKVSNALQINILSPNASTTYDYCQDPRFLPNVDDCAACYKAVPDQLYLSNCKSNSPWSCY